MTSIVADRGSVNGRAAVEHMIDEAQRALEQVMAQRLNQWLQRAVTMLLGRERYERRQHIRHWIEQQGRCARCKSHQSRRFSRNGSRPRTLSFMGIVLSIRLPRLICECGGSVEMDFGGLLRPYQRLDDQVDEQIQRWAEMGLSLRQMRQELQHLRLGPLALRTLSERLHRLQDLAPDRDLADVPPVLLIDAIWATQLRPTGRFRRDRKGRKRAVKGRVKRPIFIAMGIWPNQDRCEILAWQLGESEEAEAWIAFLGSLEAQGIRGANGLQLIIHDGGSGLCSALRTIHFDADQQRCLFHKLRNIYNAIETPDDLSPPQRRRRRKAIFKDFRLIWEAKHYQTMLRRYLKVVRTYRHTQPQAVATLRRDFRFTVTYYHFEHRFPDWQRQHLRTTSRLERFNRRIRRRLRAANAYHSDPGLQAMVAQETHVYHRAQERNRVPTD
jgi:transposase-like protein